MDFGCMASAYGSAGERCMAISVAVTGGEETGDEFIRRMMLKVQELKVGPYNDEASEMGPVVTAASREKILGYIEEGFAAGADLMIDGRDVSIQGYENGFFVGGCLFDRVTTDMSIYTDEVLALS
jgi:malonate-semialdehyde dehydrogenase (acetylating)/methylmalonate-semialdehyde dehydrogenase